MRIGFDPGFDGGGLRGLDLDSAGRARIDTGKSRRTRRDRIDRVLRECTQAPRRELAETARPIGPSRADLHARVGVRPNGRFGAHERCGAIGIRAQRNTSRQREGSGGTHGGQCSDGGSFAFGVDPLGSRLHSPFDEPCSESRGRRAVGCVGVVEARSSISALRLRSSVGGGRRGVAPWAIYSTPLVRQSAVIPTVRRSRSDDRASRDPSRQARSST